MSFKLKWELTLYTIIRGAEGMIVLGAELEGCTGDKSMGSSDGENQGKERVKIYSYTLYCIHTFKDYV
jgi:hypothetical protein